MKRASEKQDRARRGEVCLFTSQRGGCGPSPEVEIEGVILRVCAFHEERIRSIVRDAKETQAGRHPKRRAA